jgi:hypothetical protein
MNEAQRIRPSLWYLSIGVALILAGCGLFVYFLFEGIGHITDSLNPGADARAHRKTG